jgi:hypothetical protein
MKTVLTVAAVVLATAVAVSGWTAYLVRRATVHTVTHTRTVTVTVTRTSKPVIRWRTRTVASVATGIPCWEWSGGLTVLAPPQTQNSTALTCQVAEVGPSATSQFQATAPDGTTTLFTVGTP